MATTLSQIASPWEIFCRSRASYSIVKSPIWFKIELIGYVLVILVTRKMKKIRSNMKATKWPQKFRRSRASNFKVKCTVRSKIELFRDVLVVLVNCKNGNDPIKNEGARLATTFLPMFVTIEQVTTKCSVLSGPKNRSHPRLYGCPR